MGSDKSIIELAREAGFDCAPGVLIYTNDPDGVCDEELKRFAALVRAQALEEAAGVCDELNQGLRIQPTRDEFTAAIRQLKEAP